MRKFRLVFFFAITALIVITVAAAVAYRSFGHVAESNLVRIAEENTLRDALHIQSMMRTGNSMHSIAPGRSVDSGDDMKRPTPLTLEYLAGREGLPSTCVPVPSGLGKV